MATFAAAMNGATPGIIDAAAMTIGVPAQPPCEVSCTETDFPDVSHIGVYLTLERFPLASAGNTGFDPEYPVKLPVES